MVGEIEITSLSIFLSLSLFASRWFELEHETIRVSSSSERYTEIVGAFPSVGNVRHVHTTPSGGLHHRYQSSAHNPPEPPTRARGFCTEQVRYIQGPGVQCVCANRGFHHMHMRRDTPKCVLNGNQALRPLNSWGLNRQACVRPHRRDGRIHHAD